MKIKTICVLLLLVFIKTVTVKAQEKQLIFESDSIAIYDTHLSLNSLDNISPSIYNDGIIYASANKSGFYKLFFSDLKSEPQKIRIKNPYHIGSATIFKNEIYFTKTAPNFKNDSSSIFNLTVFKGIIENYKVTKEKEVSFCKSEFTYGHPTISKDGKNMVVVTNENGFFHLLELKRDENNEWQRSNVIFIAQTGYKIINPTIYDENTIYFSSSMNEGKVNKVEYAIKNGKPVVNNIYFENAVFNIYKTVKKDGYWSFPEKVSVFNSEFDDLGVVFKTEKTGYLSTFRYDNTDNIYYFELKQ